MVAGRTFAITAIAVAAGAMLVCASVAISRAVDGPRSLVGGSFPACAIPPCAPGTAETDKLVTLVRGLKSKLSKLKGMMGDWQGTVTNFGKDQRMLLRDLKEKRKKVERDSQDVEKFLKTPGPAGARGPAGVGGRPGPDGIMGPMGALGFIGYTGQRGSAGPEGREGRMGPTGQVCVEYKNQGQSQLCV